MLLVRSHWNGYTKEITETAWNIFIQILYVLFIMCSMNLKHFLSKMIWKFVSLLMALHTAYQLWSKQMAVIYCEET
jgi:hypothetical protein